MMASTLQRASLLTAELGVLALIAYLAVADSAAMRSRSAGTGVLWGLLFWLWGQ